LELEPGMNHATVSTIAADLGNTVIFPALATGGCLHVISQQRAESQALLSEYFEREGIDVLKIVPSHLAALQSGRDAEKVMPRRRLILGGEASRLDWIARLRSLAPHCEIFNHYGRTVPAGEKGELCIGGRGVARGYLNRGELTAEKFLPDPFSREAGARLYRTGDLARALPDGSIEFCGRIDHQVKLHGYRVELGEIEGALREHGAVRDAAVLVREDASGGKQLFACVVGEVAPAALREHLKERLPQYMVPSAFVLMERLPLTANGKVDRQALAGVPPEAAQPARDFAAPRSATEQALAAIWSELLGVERIG